MTYTSDNKASKAKAKSKLASPNKYANNKRKVGGVISRKKAAAKMAGRSTGVKRTTKRSRR